MVISRHQCVKDHQSWCWSCPRPRPLTRTRPHPLTRTRPRPLTKKKIWWLLYKRCLGSADSVVSILEQADEISLAWRLLADLAQPRQRSVVTRPFPPSLVPRPHPDLRHLQYGKIGRAWYLFHVRLCNWKMAKIWKMYRLRFACCSNDYTLNTRCIRQSPPTS